MLVLATSFHSVPDHGAVLENTQWTINLKLCNLKQESKKAYLPQ